MAMSLALIPTMLSVAAGHAAAQAVPFPITFTDNAVQGQFPPGDYRFTCGLSNTLEINGIDTTPRANCAEVTYLNFAFDGAPTRDHTIDVSPLTTAVIPTLIGTVFYADRLTFIGSPTDDQVFVTTAVRLEGRGGHDGLYLTTGLAIGGDGSDLLYSRGPGTARLEGGPGHDGFFLGGDGLALGGEGNDDISATNGAPTIDAGSGDDVVRVAAQVDGAKIATGTGFDRVVYSSTRELVKIRSATAAGVETMRINVGDKLNTVRDLELISVEYPDLNAVNPDVAALDVVMSPTVAIQARIELPNTKILLRVPGGVWTRSDATRTVTAPGLKKFSWALFPGAQVASPSINLKIEAR